MKGLAETGANLRAARGRIFDIQHFCLHDGPGIRTTVFLKGCPLRCAWCHNPESQSFAPELFFNPRLCIDCGSCDRACPGVSAREILKNRSQHAGRCSACMQCAGACPSGAIEATGRDVSAEEVLDELDKDRVFYEESDGGITVSGGEPVSQPQFTRAVLQLAKAQGFHTCIETCGHGSAACVVETAAQADLVLWDLKDTDETRHLSLTGAPLGPLLRNLQALDAVQRAPNIILRCLLIDGVNATREHLEGVRSVAASLRHCRGVELIAYHPFGGSKYERLGREPMNLSGVSTDAVVEARQLLESLGVTCLPESHLHSRL